MHVRVPVVFILLLSLFCQCHPEPKCANGQGIPFVNHSPVPVYVIMDLYYPDTSMRIHLSPAGMNPLPDSARRKTYPDSTCLLIRRGACREGLFNKYDSSVKLVIFVLDAHLLATTPWDTVVKKDMYTRRYDLSYNDMERMGWRIDYR